MIQKYAFIGIFAVLGVLPATAQITDATLERYNAAAGGNVIEEKLAAAEQLATEAIATPQDADATLLAYEAAWTMCSVGYCTRAVPAADFAVSQPATDAHPVMADRKLLAAYARWRAAPNNETRASLDSALSTVADEPPSMLSVSAFHNRYIADMSESDFETAKQTAAAAAAHLFPVRDQVGPTWSGAAITAAVASFNDDREPEAIIDIAKAHAEISIMRHMSPSPPDWLLDRYYTSMAWQSAMNAYFSSEGDAAREIEIADQIVDDAITDDNHTHPDGPSIHTIDGLPSCDGKFNRPPKPTYPNRPAHQGYVGAVIALMDIDESGTITPRIGASVPGDMFDDEVLRSLKRLRWKWEDTADGDPNCRKINRDVVYPFQFQLDG